MTSLSFFRRALVLLLLLLSAAAPASAQTYSIRDIGTLEFSVYVTKMNDAGQAIGQSGTSTGSFGILSDGSALVHLTLGGNHSQALDLNAGGDVVGWAYLTNNSAQRAFVHRQGITYDLNDLLPANSGWTLHHATAINDAGQIVGSGIRNNQNRGFLYTPTPGGGTIVDIGTLGGTYAWPMDINASGMVTGYSYVSNNSAYHAFLYSAGTMTDLGTLGGSYSMGTALNDAGQVVGWSYNSSNSSQRAFLHSGGSMIGIGTFGGAYSIPHDINASGHVVGYAYLPNNSVYHAFRFANGTLTDLGTLGGQYSVARGINDDGDVTGWAYTSGNSQQRAFLVQNGGAMQDANGLLASCSGRVLYEGTALNDAGQVAGYGARPGVSFGFVMSPAAPGANLTSTLSVRPVSGFYGGTVGLTAILSAEACGVSGANVTFSVNGLPGVTDATDASGFAFAGVSLAGINAGTYPNGVQATFAGDPSHSAASDTADLTVSKAVNVITWTSPASISYGTPLGATQLNATASTSGTFSYSPPAGTVLPPGTHGLTVVFLPDDPLNHVSPISESVAITVTGAQLPFTMKDLGTLGGTYSVATDVNGAGQVTGWSYDSNQRQLAFFYSNGAMTNIGTLGGMYSYPSAGINAVGTVAGYAYTANNAAYRAFIFKNGQLTDLGTLGGAYSQAVAINDAGQVTGWASDASNGQRAFLYSNGTMTDLGTLGGTHSFGQVISGSGSIAGYAYVTSNSGQHAFLYKNGQMTDLGTLGGSSSYPTALNDSDQVTGWAYTSTHEQHAFLYANGSMIDLGTLGGSHSYPSAGINASGQVAGYAYLQNNASYHAFLYSNGTLVDLGTLGGEYSYANDLNDAGDVIGGSQTASGEWHAFLYRNGQMIDLGTLGGTHSYASRINEEGDITGVAETASGQQHAFLYRNGVMTDLGTLGGSHSDPGAGVSPASHVAGYSYTSGNSAYHAFLVTPTTATTVLQASAASGPFGGTTTLTALLVSGDGAATPLAGRPVQFSINGVAVGSALTDGSGRATVANVSLAGVGPGVHGDGIQAVFAGALDYQASHDSADLTVGRITPVITWNNPADITYGTLLRAEQLNATANVPGTLTYSPAAGAKLSAGHGQTLSVAFTPDDANAYEVVPVTTVSINVLKATPVLTWADPAGIVYGTALGAAQLNATATVSGNFAYTPAAGTVLNAGTSQTLEVSFTPDDATNYNSAAASVRITVSKAPATLTLNGLSHTYDGSAKAAGAATDPAGLSGVSLTYDGSPGEPVNAGSYTVRATLTNVNYEATDATGTLTIAKAAATLTLSGLAQTYTGAPRVISASSTPGGLTGIAVTYDGHATPPVNAGTYAISATSSDPNYDVPAATGTLVVSKASATLTISSLSHTYDGTPKAAVVSSTPSGLGTVTVTYDGGAALPTAAGIYNVSASLDHANYAAPTATAVLAIAKAAQTITFDPLANRLYGDPAFAVSAAATSGLPVTFSASGACSAAGGTITLTAGGACTVTAAQGGDGNYHAATPVSRVFSVFHSWSHVRQPINVDGSSIFKLGSTVPVKFGLTGGSAGITDLVARIFVAKVSAGVIGSEVEAVATNNADGGNTFRYDPTADQYIFNLGTKTLSQGTWQIRVDLGDGATHTVLLSLRK